MNDNLTRCPWCLSSELMMSYHDREWGSPVHDDRIHFEFLTLESAQAGLSWLTVLRKREAYRKAYRNFDPLVVAYFGEEEVDLMLADPSLIRNRLKVNASINNARRFMEIQREFGSFDIYIWNFTGGQPVVNAWTNVNQIPASTKLSDVVSLDLKKRGFNFIGSTIVYAHLQAVGIVDDHLTDCFRYGSVTTQK